MIPEKNTVLKAFENAPQGLKDFIESEELLLIFSSLVDDYKIHLDNAADLSLIINAVILGIVDVSNFAILLKEVLPQSDEKTRDAILQKINSEVFIVLRDKQKEPDGLKEVEQTLQNEAIETPVVEVNKLETKKVSLPDEIEVVEPKEEPKDMSTYRNDSDPYREPIE